MGKLTPYQVSNCYLVERDDKGNLKRKPRPEKSYEQRFRETWARRGLPGWRVQELWETHLQKDAAKRSGK